jgi:hypothetical protein
MKRIAATLTMSALVLAAVAADGASAAPAATTRLVLACDRGTETASVVVTLRDGATGVATAGPIALACGADPAVGAKHARVVEVTSVPMSYAVIQPFDVVTQGESIGCAAEGTLALKFNCADSSGVGATVTIR